MSTDFKKDRNRDRAVAVVFAVATGFGGYALGTDCGSETISNSINDTETATARSSPALRNAYNQAIQDLNASQTALDTCNRRRRRAQRNCEEGLKDNYDACIADLATRDGELLTCNTGYQSCQDQLGTTQTNLDRQLARESAAGITGTTIDSTVGDGITGSQVPDVNPNSGYLLRRGP